MDGFNEVLGLEIDLELLIPKSREGEKNLMVIVEVGRRWCCKTLRIKHWTKTWISARKKNFGHCWNIENGFDFLESLIWFCSWEYGSWVVVAEIRGRSRCGFRSIRYGYWFELMMKLLIMLGKSKLRTSQNLKWCCCWLQWWTNRRNNWVYIPMWWIV